MNIHTPEIAELLKSSYVNTEEAARCLGKSAATIRRYAKSQGSKKLRNRGSDGSFRFSVYDILERKEQQLKQ